MLLAGCGIRPVCRDRLDLRKEPHAVFSKHVQIPEEGVLVPAERENADRNRNPDIDADHAAIRAAGEFTAVIAAARKDHRAIGKAVSIHHRQTFFKVLNAFDAQNRPKISQLPTVISSVT